MTMNWRKKRKKVSNEPIDLEFALQSIGAQISKADTQWVVISPNGERFNFWPQDQRWTKIGVKRKTAWTGGSGSQQLLARIIAGNAAA